MNYINNHLFTKTAIISISVIVSVSLICLYIYLYGWSKKENILKKTIKTTKISDIESVCCISDDIIATTEGSVYSWEDSTNYKLILNMKINEHDFIKMLSVCKIDSRLYVSYLSKPLSFNNKIRSQIVINEYSNEADLLREIERVDISNGDNVVGVIRKRNGKLLFSDGKTIKEYDIDSLKNKIIYRDNKDFWLDYKNDIYVLNKDRIYHISSDNKNQEIYRYSDILGFTVDTYFLTGWKNKIILVENSIKIFEQDTDLDIVSLGMLKNEHGQLGPVIGAKDGIYWISFSDVVLDVSVTDVENKEIEKTDI